MRWCVLLLFGLLIIAYAPMEAESATVDDTGDDGSPGQLRWEIMNSGDNGVVKISESLAGQEIQLDPLKGAIVIPWDNFSIEGPEGGNVTVLGIGPTPVFVTVIPDLVRPIFNKVTISRLDISGGKWALGGGILNLGTNLTLRQCGLSGNTVDFWGGGILNFLGRLTIEKCTFSDNSAVGPVTLNGAVSAGGGIFNVFGRKMTIQNSTFSGNSAGWGGAIASLLDAPSDITFVLEEQPNGNSIMRDPFQQSVDPILDSCTLTLNEAVFSGGGVLKLPIEELPSLLFPPLDPFVIITFPNIVQVQNTIIAGNTVSPNPVFPSIPLLVPPSSFPADLQEPNAFGLFDSLGSNLIGECGDNCEGFNVSETNFSDDLAAIGLSSSLAFNPALDGDPAPTATHALLPESEALDAGACTADDDQRGISRPQPAGGNCDIGAYEARNFTLTVNIQGDGSVNIDPPGTDCNSATCTETYVEGRTVALRASPSDGWKFSNWEGDCSGQNAATSVEMSEDKACTGVFEQVIRPTALCPNICTQPPSGVTILPPGECFVDAAYLGEEALLGRLMGVVFFAGTVGDRVTLTPDPNSVCTNFEWRVYGYEGVNIVDEAGQVLNGSTCYGFELVDEPAYYHVEAWCRDFPEMFAFAVVIRPPDSL